MSVSCARGFLPLSPPLTLAAAASSVLLFTLLYRYRTPKQNKHLDTLITLSQQAFNQKKLHDAIRFAKDAIHFAHTNCGTSHPQTLKSMMHLAAIYTTMREETKAINVLNESLNATRVGYGDGHLDEVPVLHALAEVLEDFGQSEEAIPHLLHARDIRRHHLGSKHMLFAESCYKLASLHARRAVIETDLTDDQRSGELVRAVELVLDANEIAATAGHVDKGIEFVKSLFELVSEIHHFSWASRAISLLSVRIEQKSGETL